MVSTRQSTKYRRGDASPGDSGEDYCSEEGSGSVAVRGPKSRTSRKATPKQKGKQPGKRRRAGKLSKLPDMPLDILYEIFCLVHPVDLLRMSWANKAFHSVLTNKSSRHFWVAAFDNIPDAQRPPPCPEDLTEIAYSNLLYNPRCMSCSAPRAPAYWAARVRVCMSCIKNWVAVTGGVQDRSVIALSHDKLYSSSQILPTIYIKIPPFTKKIHVFTKDLERLIADLEATADKAAVIERYSVALAAKNKLAQALERLEKIEKADREAVLMAAHDKRIEQILERLVDEGWAEEITSHGEDYVRSLTQVKGVKVARPLTEKGWEEIEARVLEAMQTCRGEIEDKVLRARCLSRVSKMSTIAKKYHRTLHPHDFYLSVDDVCRFPDIRKAIIGGTDEEFNTCAEGVISGLPRLTSQSLEKRAAKISVLLPFDERPDNVLSLATTWFECGSCNPSLLHGTKALGHQCHILRSWPPDGPVGEVTFDIHVGRGWCAETSKFTFSKVASAIARELIIGCGEDPESITLAEMNSKAHRFAVYENGALVARNWRETFDHQYRTPAMYHRPLGPEEFPEFVHDPDAHNEEMLWNCLLCWRRDGGGVFRVARFATLPIVKQHITIEHSVDAPAEGVDYFYKNQHRPPKFVRVITTESPESSVAA